MSFQYGYINESPATGAVAVFNILTALVAQGWTVQSWSDGTTYHSTPPGTVGFSSGASGAGGFGNASAWVVIQQPAGGSPPFSGTRQWCIQHKSNTNNTALRIKISFTAGFSGGSPGATQVPSATDEQVILGSGSDASPTAATIFLTDGTYRQQIVYDSAAPWAWFSLCYVTGGGVVSSLIGMDPLTTYDTGDTDPNIWLCGVSDLKPAGIGTYGSTAYAFIGTPGATTFLQVAAGFPVSGAGAFAQNLGSSPWTSSDWLLPIFWGRDASQLTPIGPKGISSVFQANMVSRATGDTESVSTSKDHANWDALVTAWNGTSPTV